MCLTLYETKRFNLWFSENELIVFNGTSLYLKMNKVHVCNHFLDLAIHLYWTNPHEIPERKLGVRKFSDFMPEFILTLDLGQYEWNSLVAYCLYFYSYYLETVSIDDLVLKFQLNCIHTWHETSNWGSSSSDTASNPSDSYTAIDKEIIKAAKVNSTIFILNMIKIGTYFVRNAKAFFWDMFNMFNLILLLVI